MHDPRAEAERWLVAAGEDLDYAHHAAAGGYHARYPNGLERGTPAQAFSKAQSERALELAARFIEAARGRLRGLGNAAA